MRKLALVVLLALALPATAAAKGPSRAAIAGPGTTTIRISGAEGSSTPFWRFVGATGWFEAAWGSPSHLPQEQPQAELGPRFTITWRVPSSSNLLQDVYPYAKPSPLTYMPPGQRLYGTPVKGGWYAGGARLEKVLLRIGVPAVPPASATSAASPAPDGIAAAAALFALAGAASSLRPRS
ncbi:MAG TPA: hypothetical protein VJU01_09285 [Gaiellaceae bacterium]|nr:hypothetical protein [Gaiellaceae bacterium]